MYIIIKKNIIQIQENVTQQHNIARQNTNSVQQELSQHKTIASNQVHLEHAYSRVHKPQTTPITNPRQHLYNQNTIPVQENQRVENILLIVSKVISNLVDNISEEKMNLVQNIIKTFFQSNDDLEETDLYQSSIC